MTATKRSEADQDVEQVAGIIYDHLAYDSEGFTRHEANEINRTTGWSFEVRYDTHFYVRDSDYTRVEGRALSPAELSEAWRLAEEWIAG